MLPWSADLAGRHRRGTRSPVGLLRGNPLADPNERPLLVYVPPGYDSHERRYPTSTSSRATPGTSPCGATAPVPPAVPGDRRHGVRAGDIPPAVVVFVDAWTSYGGSQFVDSPAPGGITATCARRWCPGSTGSTGPARPGHRAIRGSPPGVRRDDYADAATGPVRRAGLHSGDSLYEFATSPSSQVGTPSARYDGDIGAWWADFRSRTPFTKPEDNDLLDDAGVSACFSATRTARSELPFDPARGDPSRYWQRWLDWDPVRMAPRYADVLRSCAPYGSTPVPATSGSSISAPGVLRQLRADTGYPTTGPLRAVRRQPRRRRLPLPAVARVALPPHRGLRILLDGFLASTRLVLIPSGNPTIEDL